MLAPFCRKSALSSSSQTLTNCVRILNADLTKDERDDENISEGPRACRSRGLSALTIPATAEAGRGWGGHGWGDHGYYGGRGWGGSPGYWGAGLIGLGVGAAIGSALAAPVYVDPYVDAPPPPPAAYAPVAAGYGPAPWSSEWYDYCAQRYRSFNARTGYFMGYDGQPHFCQ